MNAVARKKGLGRGLEALLGGSADITEAVTIEGAPNVLPLGKLQAGKYQPRTRMDEGALQELAASIRAQGLMQPILVRSIRRDKYEIIAGERRFRAARIAGLDEVPVLVKNVPDQAAAAMALIENIQREDLNPLEEAQGIQRLLDEFNFTHEQAAESVGRSRSAVSNLLRLLESGGARADDAARRRSRHGPRARAAGRRCRDADSRWPTRSSTSGCRCAKPKSWSRRRPRPCLRQRRGTANDGGRDTRRLEEELSDLLSANGQDQARRPRARQGAGGFRRPRCARRHSWPAARQRRHTR